MGVGKPDKEEAERLARLPGELVRQLESHARPASNRPTQTVPIPVTSLSTLTIHKRPKEAPPLNLNDHLGQPRDLRTLEDNIWSTSGPPGARPVSRSPPH
jgi:hypothetical protein